MCKVKKERFKKIRFLIKKIGLDKTLQKCYNIYVKLRDIS